MDFRTEISQQKAIIDLLDFLDTTKVTAGEISERVETGLRLGEYLEEYITYLTYPDFPVMTRQLLGVVLRRMELDTRGREYRVEATRRSRNNCTIWKIMAPCVNITDENVIDSGLVGLAGMFEKSQFSICELEDKLDELPEQTRNLLRAVSRRPVGDHNKFSLLRDLTILAELPRTRRGLRLEKHPKGEGWGPTWKVNKKEM